MKPVDQTRLEWPHGDCLAAASASILELGLEAFPDLYRESERRGSHEEHWWGVYLESLQRHGYTAAFIPNGVDGYAALSPRGYAIASIRFPIGHVSHAVVMLDGVPVHDPHPRRAALLGVPFVIEAWYVLIPVVARAA